MMMGMGHIHTQYYSQKAKAFMEIGAGLLNLLFSLKLQMKRAFPIIHTVYIHTQIQYYTPYTTYPTLPLYFLCFLLLLLHQPLASAMTMASARSIEAARFFASTTALVAPTLHTYYTCQCAFMLSTTKSYKTLMMIKKKLLFLVKI